ncbi:uncharacterized protein G2W53_032504 [Senna tora]|uniref:Uncharacterized protein n=1 Tax=Senna tora TaxID=362788 RepID=A0A834SXN5_9FABA|nr:uncharacterized protein G2W53_032504 [Senna tora]
MVVSSMVADEDQVVMSERKAVMMTNTRQKIE